MRVTDRDVAAQEELMKSVLRTPFQAFGDSIPLTFVKRRARGEAFRRQVIALYGGRCIVCGGRWEADGNYETQAAHVIPKSSSGSDDPRNGIALCRFHHWAFDHGLFSLSDECAIIVSPRISDFSDKSEVMKAFAGSKVLLPEDARARPDLAALKWHRTKIFLA